MSQDPYRYFRVEARETLDSLGKAVMDLEKGPAPAHISRILRLAHTLKGAARVVKQREIADSAHAIEDALAPFRESSLPVSSDQIELVLRMLDEIAARVTALTPPPEPAAGGTAARTQPDEVFRTVRADVAEVDGLLEGIAETHVGLGVLRKHFGEVDRLRQLVDRLEGQVGTPQAQPIRGGDGKRDDGIRLIANELRTLSDGLGHNLRSGAEQIDRELRQVRDAAEQMRLVPAGTLFTSLERTARDAAQALGKSVAFEGRSGEVRLDAHVLAPVQTALQHIVRNAVTHGIERATDRIGAGKPAEGRVTLQVARRGRRVAFICMDDGRGVDLDAVRRVVRAKDALRTGGRDAGARDLLPLLLKGGISTTHTVTEVSGRGIGMDVVREVAERLGGDVSMGSEPGRGTTVELVVPVSLASLDGLVVQAAGTTATIPLDAVQQALRVPPSELTRSKDGDSVVHEGKVIPFVPLSRVLSVPASPASGNKVWTAVVVRGAAGAAAFGVERLLGTANVVLQPLPGLAPGSPVVTGASLDVDGIPQLVLDPDALVVEAGHAATAPSEPEAPSAPLLIIDDSLTTRMLERSILESAGFEVDVATSGEEALEKARRRRYGLFLVDVEMPGMDGFAFIESVRADPALAMVPSILVTSRSSSKDRLRGEEVGARAYMAKDEFDQGALLKRIRELVA